jgi:hypothetical protein
MSLILICYIFPCINQIHNTQITNKLHYNVYGAFFHNFLNKHVVAAIAIIFR